MALPTDLRVRLRERRNRLYKSDHLRYETELGIFLEWLESYEYFRGILAEIQAAPIDFEEWRTSGIGYSGLVYPSVEIERAKVCLEVARAEDWEALVQTISTSSNFNEMFREFTEAIIDPLVDFIEDRIEDGSEILSILLRYKRRVEWFEASELQEKYSSDTKRGEDHLDSHLRRYLLDQGVDFPFSQPASPSGEADIVANIGSEDPLSLEVKLFLPDASKDKAYVRKGFSQAVRYANDYGLHVGYLVVFNLTPESLVFEVESPRPGAPPSIQMGDKVIFLLSVDTHSDRPTASNDPKLARSVITEEYLIGG